MRSEILVILKDCVRSHAESVSGALATIGIAASPSERRFQLVDFLFPIAARASDAIGPALGDDVFLAGVIGRERSVELFVSHHGRTP
jgi:hypothetical protein